MLLVDQICCLLHYIDDNLLCQLDELQQQLEYWMSVQAMEEDDPDEFYVCLNSSLRYCDDELVCLQAVLRQLEFESSEVSRSSEVCVR